MSLIRVSEKRKDHIDKIRLANRVSADEVVSKLIKKESMTPPPAKGLSPNDEYRLQRIEAFFELKKIDLDKIVEEKERIHGA